MKMSAFESTSGLGQLNEGPIESPPSDFTDMTSKSSGPGELHRELLALLILTKSPLVMNFSSGIVNGGGGGGIGSNGDAGAITTLS